MRRGRVLAVLGAAAALAGIAGITVWALTRPPSIEDAAQAYLDALGDGDLPAIQAMRADRLGPDEEDALAAAFDAAAGYLTGGEVLEADQQGSVVASGALGDGEVSLAFTMVEREGTWMLDTTSLTSLRVHSPLGDAAWVGGALVSLDTDVLLLPAVYDVAPAPRGILEGTQAVVVAAEGAAVTLEPELAATATVQAQAQLDAYAQGCAASAPEVPAHCGLRVPWAADLASLDEVAFRVDAYPTVTLDLSDASFAATGGVIVVTATGPAREGGRGSFTYRSDDWSMYGEVTFAGDQMGLRVR